MHSPNLTNIHTTHYAQLHKTSKNFLKKLTLHQIPLMTFLDLNCFQVIGIGKLTTWMCRCLFGQEKKEVAIVARGAMMGMKGAWVWYRFHLQQQPIRTQMVTSGILWAIGDAIAQSVSRSIEQRLAMKENSTTTIVSVHTIMAFLPPFHLFSFSLIPIWCHHPLCWIHQSLYTPNLSNFTK